MLGVPFSLTTSWNGKTATLITKYDLQLFMETLDLPPTDFFDWRMINSVSSLQRPERWQQVPTKAQQRNRSGRHRPIPTGGKGKGRKGKTERKGFFFS